MKGTDVAYVVTAMSDQVQQQRIKLSTIKFSDDHHVSLKCITKNTQISIWINEPQNGVVLYELISILNIHYINTNSISYVFTAAADTAEN
jgi:hypothetical protein